MPFDAGCLILPLPTTHSRLLPPASLKHRICKDQRIVPRGFRTLLAPAEIRGRRTLQLLLPADSAVDLETATTSLHSAESAVALQDWRRAWPAALAAQYISRRRFLAEFEAGWMDQWRRHLDVIHERALACYAEACLGIGGTELPAAERIVLSLLAAPLTERALLASEELRRRAADDTTRRIRAIPDSGSCRTALAYCTDASAYLFCLKYLSPLSTYFRRSVAASREQAALRRTAIITTAQLRIRFHVGEPTNLESKTDTPAASWSSDAARTASWLCTGTPFSQTLIGPADPRRSAAAGTARSARTKASA